MNTGAFICIEEYLSWEDKIIFKIEKEYKIKKATTDFYHVLGSELSDETIVITESTFNKYFCTKKEHRLEKLKNINGL